MFLRRGLMIAGLFVFSTAIAAGQAGRNAHVIFKDGYTIKGMVNEKVREVLFDSKSGRAFPILSGDFFLEDHTTSVMFSSGQVQKVIPIQAGQIKEPIRITRFTNISQLYQIYPDWVFPTTGVWDDKGDRVINATTRSGPKAVNQKIAVLTSQQIFARSEKYQWDLGYYTQEFDPTNLRKIIMHVFNEKKDLKVKKDGEKFILIGQFLKEAGFFKEAEIELKSVAENFPAERKAAEEALTRLRKDWADVRAEAILKAVAVGQHGVAQDRIDAFINSGQDKIVSDDARLNIVDYKSKYEKSKSDLDKVRLYFKDAVPLARNGAVWAKAAEFIDSELNYDTVDRLDRFLTFGEQFQADRMQKRKPSVSADELLAIAVSGWLQGKQSAENDVKSAQRLLRTREFLHGFFQCDNNLKRTNLLSAFRRDNAMPIDVIARMLTMMPPPGHDPATCDTNVRTMTIKVPDGGEGSYLVQLPPDYHPLRSYPVLMVLQSTREKAEDTLKRFSDEASTQGMILVAPLWAGNAGLPIRYNFRDKEQAVALDALRDVRRRFQVDSNRVFLFGWEAGGTMAYDVALGHPDLFAGVAIMNGVYANFARQFYWPNAQYLPFYIVDGDRYAKNPDRIRDLFKKWTRDPYQALYVEYHGRGVDFYAVEVPKMLDWMNRKRRAEPMKDLGRTDPLPGLGQEFRSSRHTDTQFYWLRTDEILLRTQHSHTDIMWAGGYKPATFQGNISLGNKKGANGKPEIWTQLNLRVYGLKNVSFWITPGLITDANELRIVVNGQFVGQPRRIEPNLDTMLEELFHTGDRQRLYIAKIDIKL
ncbi:MAG: alpha/beta hydrolase [Gemmataceae bacterium]|nr:alpha/beta hydrolase [Gemmataceae bacterium]